MNGVKTNGSAGLNGIGGVKAQLNGSSPRREDELFGRADEVKQLLDAVQELIVPFIRSADDSGNARISRTGTNANAPLPPTMKTSKAGETLNTLVDYHSPSELLKLLKFELPEHGKGKDGLLENIRSILRYSVNTWDQGFLDKLYASTNAVGVVSELLLAVLNTNLHVYHVSPALTLIERQTARQLAALFGLTGPHAGGVTQPGGSASNLTSLLIARNTLYPESKITGNAHYKFCIITSEHAHYSLEKAAMILGFGTGAVFKVPVDGAGRMRPELVEGVIESARDKGYTPLYINATAGTTVLGAYDPIEPLHAIAKKHNLWLHVDGSWGGSAIFSTRPVDSEKLSGVHLADSITINPHKMLNVPVTCSFLLGADTRSFRKANSLDAGYLFHSDDDMGAQTEGEAECWDLADLTLQCGRKGDAVKLALGWVYYGKEGYARMVENTFMTAERLTKLLRSHLDEFEVVGDGPAPQCGQVCFYYIPPSSSPSSSPPRTAEDLARRNSETTRRIVKGLVGKGFMVDYAPGEKGEFIRVVVNAQTRWATVVELVEGVRGVGRGL